MDFFLTLGEYIHFYPLVAFVSLLLAGLSVPVSEDLVIITGALLNQAAVQDKVPGTKLLLITSLLTIYVGVFISDCISFYMGSLIRKGVLKAKYTGMLFSQKNMDWIHKRLDKHGFLTFIICRFIPFGVRNLLFMSSGFLGLPFKRFALYTGTAALISTNTLFFLVYIFGDAISYPIKVAGIILFSALALTMVVLVIRSFKRLTLTPWGLPQVVVYPTLVAAIMTALVVFFRSAFWVIPLEVILFIILIWMLSFFRNPKREIIPDESILYSPADGKITDISRVEDEQLGSCLRIGIFLSVFNVHLNRAPCSGTVQKITYKKGMFKDARDPDSSRVNESNAVLLKRLAEPDDLILVKQISGAIARRIVCKAQENDELKQGALFGMIKFGSRTELFLPASDDKYKVIAAIGDAVYAGITPLIKYNQGL